MLHQAAWFIGLTYLRGGGDCGKFVLTSKERLERGSPVLPGICCMGQPRVWNPSAVYHKLHEGSDPRNSPAG
jgi:hypothetical protein